MSVVAVRSFAAADVPPANALTNHFIVHTTVHFAAGPATDAEFEADWRSGSRAHPWLTATVGSTFAGYAKAGTWRSRAAYDRTAETAIYVGVEHRRRGVGRILYAALLDRLAAAGFRAAIGGIALPNPGSVALHEALGFHHVGTFRGVGFKFGGWHDVGFWQRQL